MSVSEKEILWRDHCKRESIIIELSVVYEKEYLKLSRALSEKEILTRADYIREGNTIES